MYTEIERRFGVAKSKAKFVEVILSHKGCFGMRRVSSEWLDTYIPARRLSDYIKGAEDIDSDEDIKFVPSGKQAVKDGKIYDLWVVKEG